LEKKVWARSVSLTAGQTVSLTLTNPASADLDLFVYADTPITLGDSEGEPQIVASSVRPGLGGAEVLQYTPSVSGRFYVVVKFVTGRGGAFQLASAATPDFAVLVSPGTQPLESKGDSVTYQVTVTGLGGFTGAVTLSTAGTLPAGITTTFNPATVNANGSSTLTLATTAATPGGLQTVTVQGTAGSVTRTAVAGLTVGAVWPRFHHDARSSGRSAFNGPQTLRQPWPFPYGVEVFSSPAIGADGTIYFGDRDGSINAVNAKDGTFLWFRYLDSGAPVDSSPAIGFDGTIFFGADDGALYAYLPDGTQKWQVGLGTAAIRSGPALGPDGTIYVTAGGTLYAVRPEDGARKWSFSPTGAAVNSSPTIGPDGTIYFGAGSSTGTAANRLYAVRDTGTNFANKWDFPVTGNVRSTPLAANGRIYFGSDGDNAGGRLYVLTDGGTSAAKVAETPAGGAVQSSPAVGPDGSVYVGCNDTNLYAFAADGTVRWRFATAGQVISSPAVGADGIIYFGSRDTRVFAVRDQGGSNRAQVWSFRTDGEVQASPAIGADGTVYTPSFDGSITAFADSAKPDFLVTSINPGQSAVLVGVTASYTVRLQAINGFTGPVTFQVVGTMPAGMTASFTPAQITLGASGTGQTTLRFATTSATPAGEFLFTVRATSGTTVRDAPYASLLLADYTLVGQPATQRVTVGQSTAFSVALLPNPTYATLPITVSTSAAIVAGPTGGTPPSFTFDTTSIALPGLLTISAATSPATLPGTYEVEVRGVSGAVTRTARLKLEVGGYNLTTPQATQRVTAGGNTSFTVNVESVLGFTGNVALTVSTPPSGVTAALTPASLAAPGAATLNVTTATSTTPGSYPLTVTGTSGGITRMVDLTLEVAGFNATVATAAATVTAGSSATFTVNVASLFGFNQPVTLAASGTPPAGVVLTFNPASLTGTGTATLTVATTTATPTGATTLTFTATAGGITRTVTVTLTVNAPP
jgi:outer membrane protein assembly factor BamB